jgi:undecaprenyl-diphosphatase
MNLSILEAIILGLVEGITEFLPISSTGHLILATNLLGLDDTPAQKEAMDAFNIVIQGGAILAVLGLYRARVWQMIRGLLGRDAVGLKLFFNILIAFLPAAIIGVMLEATIEKHLFSPIPVLSALAVGGVAMIFIGRWQRRFFHGAAPGNGRGVEGAIAHVKPRAAVDAHSYVDLDHLTWQRALIIGLMQCLAMWPGTSRSMVTIVGGMLVGMRPRHAAEFSFLLGLPTLTGACVYKGAKNLMGEGPDMIETLGIVPLIVGFITATVAAALAVKWLVAFLNKHGLAAFGWYRLVLCAVLGTMIYAGVVTL